jgi:hypothetical protein
MIDASTVHVDAAAPAAGADGTAARPFPTVAAALAVAPGGALVAVAAGDYAGAPVLDRPVRLAGRCSARVTLRGIVTRDATAPAVTIQAGAAGSAVRGVTLTGPGVGLRVAGARQVLVEAVEIRGAGGLGVDLSEGAEITLRRVKISAATMTGVWVSESGLRAEQVVVEGTRPDPATGAYGSGLGAECSAPERCGPLTLTSTVVTGNRRAGVVALGAETVIRGSVIRDTLPRESDQRDGQGVVASCAATDSCGSLVVEASWLARNRTMGLLAENVPAVIRGSVIRDTVAQASDGWFGRGLQATCHPETGSCSTLRVEDSLVTGNRMHGIASFGAEVTVGRSVVRGTWADQDSVGTGIAAFCFPAAACGELRVEGSLIEGNEGLGVRGAGPTLGVHGSVIRDTEPRASDGQFGYGVLASCDGTSMPCSPLEVDGTIVSGNHGVGVLALGETSIRASVVRDTGPRASDRQFGRGIEAYCGEGVCGRLVVEGTLVAGNRDVGVIVFGRPLTILGSTIRDTLPQESNQEYGSGIYAGCDLDAGSCGELLVEDSRVSGNRSAGIIGFGPTMTIHGSAVTGTLPRVSDGQRGRGIEAYCESALEACGRLRVEDSLVAENHDHGIFGMGVKSTIRGVVVRHTWSLGDDPRSGRGIGAQCDRDLGVCGFLELDDSLIIAHASNGIYSGVSTMLTGVAVIDSGVGRDGTRTAAYGQGVFAECDYHCEGKVMLWSLVSGSHGAGVSVLGPSGLMLESVVEDVQARPDDGRFGYGIQLGGYPPEWNTQSSFDVESSVVRDARLAGLLFYAGAGGSLRGSVVTGGEYCVAKNEGTVADVLDDNILGCEVQSEPAWVNLEPAPAPPPATPTNPAGH